MHNKYFTRKGVEKQMAVILKDQSRSDKTQLENLKRLPDYLLLRQFDDLLRINNCIGLSLEELETELH